MRRPDILILEGLNVLQVSMDKRAEFVSDYFDFSIYIDADEADIREWYVQRFFALRETVFKDPNSFFRHFADLTPSEARATAEGIWAQHQRPQPQREHPADARAGVADPAQGSRPPRLGGPPPQALTAGRSGRRHPAEVGAGDEALGHGAVADDLDGVEREAPPQHQQQVVGRAADRRVALGVLARDDVAAGAVVDHQPLAGDVGAVQVHRPGQRCRRRRRPA